jgi:hypothetical protein
MTDTESSLCFSAFERLLYGNNNLINQHCADKIYVNYKYNIKVEGFG